MNPRMKLKAVRVENGDTQEDAAKIINVSKETYNQKELGKRDFTLTEAVKLAKYYKKTLDQLFFDNSVNTNKTA
ncbi:putative transcriptional regulator [Gottschalkia purinilytica]|uniref:Putative transcriptional regulator n=1 Tax=Gottschalkia purinilytica TaxID=1503 RepID=A0A0L0W959_GOTPU|nr:helix-turn-helix domain-containing protein [Gottschalkia purinilytica]KNF08093.1 putative transcriptional regulator [Gottschalkia purinilytica]